MKGTYVEGIKEEVVLSPAHALSLIASGEEHRHVGSNNFNFVSSRSHTIFTLTIESSPSGADDDGEEIKLCARPKLYGYELELHMLTVLNCELNGIANRKLQFESSAIRNSHSATAHTIPENWQNLEKFSVPEQRNEQRGIPDNIFNEKFSV
ncbi:centromere-associated protein E [Carex littledalei]|uniref:Centromere-associated protein E n=1 Tax=Carex littledalei TaxID=544730 RepID=A0A833QAW3_9POAL|nr:centromere-associated protein E [Carex littledalei]